MEFIKSFKKKFVELTKKYKIGNKLSDDCDMGPMITEKEAIRVESWGKRSCKVRCNMSLWWQA